MKWERRTGLNAAVRGTLNEPWKGLSPAPGHTAFKLVNWLIYLFASRPQILPVCGAALPRKTLKVTFKLLTHSVSRSFSLSHSFSSLPFFSFYSSFLLIFHCKTRASPTGEHVQVPQIHLVTLSSRGSLDHCSTCPARGGSLRFSSAPSASSCCRGPVRLPSSTGQTLLPTVAATSCNFYADLTESVTWGNYSASPSPAPWTFAELPLPASACIAQGFAWLGFTPASCSACLSAWAFYDLGPRWSVCGIFHSFKRKFGPIVREIMLLCGPLY